MAVRIWNWSGCRDDSSNAADYVTIDSYFLSVLIEYGLLGFIAYYGIFAIAIYEGSRRYLTDTTDNEDQSFLLPITASFIAFMIAKFVFSQQDNHPVVFMMLGALLALVASRRTLANLSKQATGVIPQSVTRRI